MASFRAKHSPRGMGAARRRFAKSGTVTTAWIEAPTGGSIALCIDRLPGTTEAPLRPKRRRAAVYQIGFPFDRLEQDVPPRSLECGGLTPLCYVGVAFGCLGRSSSPRWIGGCPGVA